MMNVLGKLRRHAENLPPNLRFFAEVILDRSDQFGVEWVFVFDSNGGNLIFPLLAVKIPEKRVRLQEAWRRRRK